MRSLAGKLAAVLVVSLAVGVAMSATAYAGQSQGGGSEVREVTFNLGVGAVADPVQRDDLNAVVDTGVVSMGQGSMFQVRSQLPGFMLEMIGRAPECMVGECSMEPTLGILDAVSGKYAWHLYQDMHHTVSAGVHSHIRVMGRSDGDGAEAAITSYAFQPGVVWELRGHQLELLSAMEVGPNLVVHRDGSDSGDLGPGFETSGETTLSWRVGPSMRLYGQVRGGVQWADAIGTESFAALQAGIAVGRWR